MKKLNIPFFSILTILLSGCSGSDVYRDSWNAMTEDGKKYIITFDAKKFSIKDSVGQIKSYSYSQNSVEIKNLIKTYGIQLGDGRHYQIHLPKANNDSVGVIKDDSGRPMYTISRHNFVSYNDIYRLE